MFDLGTLIHSQMRRPRAAGPAVLPVPPAARWHPGFSTVAEAGGRVVSATDLRGLAALTEGAAGAGPRVMTDALGRRFWRFEGAEFLAVATTLAAVSNRAVSVFAVARMHRATANNVVFGLGNAGAGTAVNTGLATLEVATGSTTAPLLRSHGRSGSLDAANAPWMIAGAQLQVLGAASRTAAAGGTRLMVNSRSATMGENTILAAAVSGAEVGRYPFSPGSSGNWGMFDLYELVVYAQGLTDAQMTAVQAALVGHWGIPAVTDALVLEGDSITQGTGAVTSGISAAMLLTEPGMNRIPPAWRVINMGSVGAQVSNLVTRRDAANGWASLPLPGGRNVAAVEIGRNDLNPAGGNLTATQHYNNVVAYLTATGSGLLPRGWTVRVLANIAASPTIQPQIDSYRAMLRAPAFASTTQTGSGQAWEGRLSVVATDQIAQGGNSIFLTSADAADTTFYAGDNTHPNVAGALLRVTGGDDPARGIAWGL